MSKWLIWRQLHAEMEELGLDNMEVLTQEIKKLEQELNSTLCK